ncbi:unnamed protein product [Amoebophrya sp. A120]|nr:unnamed protein product [Amoebophrya sp. A120]|eukprot:GSA120T00019038001.1
MESDLTARVYAACDPGSIDFCCTLEDLTDLETEISLRLEQLHPRELGVREDLQALVSVVQLQVLFAHFDAHLGERKYEQCAAEYQKAKILLETTVTCTKPAAILQDIAGQLEVQFRQRAVLFSSRMERNFQNIFSFLPNTICINRSEKNLQVWEGLRTMELLESKTKWLSERMHKYILAPLFVDSRRKKLSARIFKPHDEVTVWSFVDENESLESGEEGLEFLLGILGSMIGYLRDFLAHNEALAALGRHLWPLLVDYLRDCSGEPQLLLEFQNKAAALGFVDTTRDASLTSLAAERKTGVQARAKILEEARNWMVSQDMTTVQVSATSENDKLMAGLDKDLAQYLWTPCAVSQSVLRLVEEVRNSVRLGIRDPAQTKDQQMLTRQLVTLFLLVRPHVHRGKLTADPFSGGIFYNDCLYFAFCLTVLPFEHGSNRPLAWLVDVVPSLRKLGQAHLVTLLKFLRRELGKKCEHLQQYMRTISEDASYAAAEAVLSTSLQYLRTAVSSFAAVLPKKLLLAVTSMLTEQYLEMLLRSLVPSSSSSGKNGSSSSGGGTSGSGSASAGASNNTSSNERTATGSSTAFLLGGGSSANAMSPSLFAANGAISPQFHAGDFSGGTALAGSSTNIGAPRTSDEQFFQEQIRWTDPLPGLTSGPSSATGNSMNTEQQTTREREMADRNCISYLFSSVRVQVEQLLSQRVKLGDDSRSSCFDVIGTLIPMLENDDIAFTDVKYQLQQALSRVEHPDPLFATNT